ncbi:MAG TPA: aminopeptidase P family protein, partial [Arthrobacter sp.]|nr:aminopeptidase P family protein [Arthrobacter sp.]
MSTYQTENASQQPAGEQPLEDRVNNRSQRPESDAFKEFMGSRWAPADSSAVEQAAVAPYAARRRRALS